MDITCNYCNGSGTLEGVPCTYCGGDGQVSLTDDDFKHQLRGGMGNRGRLITGQVWTAILTKVADVEDKVNDVIDKCNDIMEKLNE